MVGKSFSGVYNIIMPSWNKGLTKETNLSLLKTSHTMKARGLDNFAKWREEMKKRGIIKSEYPELERGGDLAELIGVILGDGHIRKYPRTEELSIFSNSKNAGFITRYGKLVEKIFNRKPAITKHSGKNCTRIRIYEKNISKRLCIPFSPRLNKKLVIPSWILREKRYIIRYLRGLYEAEGSFCVHLPTNTYKFLFSNKNSSLLNNVFRSLKILGFHPHLSNEQVQISKKLEVYKCKELLKFRKY